MHDLNCDMLEWVEWVQEHLDRLVEVEWGNRRLKVIHILGYSEVVEPQLREFI